MDSRWARVARGFLASGLAIFVAALFHVAGGGAVPGPVPLALSLAFATLAAIALTARRLSLWRLTISVGISQFLFHLLFSLGGGTADFSSSDGSPLMAHVHSGSHLVMSSGLPAAHADMGALPTSPGMWPAHAAAVLVTVIALRFGERTFWGLFETARLGVARLAERVLSAVSLIVPTFGPTPSERVGAEPTRLRDLGIPLGHLRHRGPPAAVAAF
jgi:hypothetical protein